MLEESRERAGAESVLVDSLEGRLASVRCESSSVRCESSQRQADEEVSQRGRGQPLALGNARIILLAPHFCHTFFQKWLTLCDLKHRPLVGGTRPLTGDDNGQLHPLLR